MALTLPLGLAFVLWQRCQARTGGPGLLPFGLLTEPRLIAGLSLVALLLSGLPGLLLVFSVMFQTAFGLNPSPTGLVMAPFPIGVIAGSLLGGRIGSAKTGPRIAIGAAILAFNILWLRLVLPEAEAAAFAPLLPPLFLAGIGMGVAAPALLQSVMAAVPTGSSGVASGAAHTFQQIGAAAGIAISIGIFTAALARDPQAGRAAATASAFPLAVFSTVAVSTGLRALFARHTGNQSGEPQCQTRN